VGIALSQVMGGCFGGGAFFDRGDCPAGVAGYKQPDDSNGAARTTLTLSSVAILRIGETEGIANGRIFLGKIKHNKKELCIFDDSANIAVMKHTTYFCWFTLLLGAAAIAPSYGQESGSAQTASNSSLQSEAQGGTKKRHASPDAIKKRQLSVLKKEAALTADQESKVTPIISKYVDDVVALKDDTSLVGAAKREKRKTLHTQYVNDIDAVLTPDQQKSWAAANAARLERLRSARAAAKPNTSGAESE
jgi:Spy/CpxP family protein refolding chaperone